MSEVGAGVVLFGGLLHFKYIVLIWNIIQIAFSAILAVPSSSRIIRCRISQDIYAGAGWDEDGRDA